MKKPLEDIYGDLDFASDRISTQVRMLVLGVLALVWAFLSSAKDVLPLKLGGSKTPLVLIGGLCILTLALDLSQYIAFYVSANNVRKKAESSNHAEAEYDESSVAWISQQVLFWAKQLTTLCAAVWLLALILVSVL